MPSDAPCDASLFRVRCGHAARGVSAQSRLRGVRSWSRFDSWMDRAARTVAETEVPWRPAVAPENENGVPTVSCARRPTSGAAEPVRDFAQSRAVTFVKGGEES